MKKIISCLLAVVTLTSSVPAFAATQTNHTVYDLNFDGGDTSVFAVGSASVSSVEGGIDGGKAVYVEGYSNEEEAPCINLNYLNRASYSQISVYVKPVTESAKATARLVVTLNESGVEKSYTLDEKEIGKNSWTKLSDTLHTKYKTLLSSPAVSVVVTDSNGVCSYMLDNFSVKSDQASLENYQEVPKIEHDGKYTVRTAFENNTVERFKYDTYTAQIPEYYCTDEIPAHTGKNSCLVTGRVKQDETVTIMLDGIDKNAKVKISCWLHNGPGLNETTFYVRGWLPTPEGTKWDKIIANTTVKNEEWIELSGVLDLSKYNLNGTPGFQIMTVEKCVDYYIDDILVTADCEGDLYDDMNYKEPERGEELSDTAYRYVPKNIPIQQDIPSLKEVFKDYFKIGMAVQDKNITNKGRFGEIMAKHCNSLVAEGSYKASNILSNSPTGKVYNFALADEFADFAHKNGFEAIGHVLVWETGSYNIMTTDVNGKFLSRDEILAFMKEYITKMIRHFEGDGDASEYTVEDYENWHLSVWDVVNEAAFGTTADGYSSRGSGFRSIVGTDFVQYAFQFAEDVGYDNIELRYNDFGEQNEDKLNAIYNICKTLLDNGKKLDIIGMQSHYNPTTTASSVRRAIEKLSSLGTKIDITELDMRAYTDAQVQARKKIYENGIPKEVEFVQANLWYELWQLYREYSDIIDRVVMWSITDKLSSTNETNGFDRTDYGNMFDRSYQAKPQYWAAVDPEYYFKEIVKEDNSKLRISFNTSTKTLLDDSYFEENGILYIDIHELLGVMNDLKYFVKDGKISVIRNGAYYEMTKDSKTAIADFKEYTLKNSVVEKNQRLYAPYEELCDMMRYGSSYSELRNLVTITEYEHGEILDATNLG